MTNTVFGEPFFESSLPSEFFSQITSKVLLVISVVFCCTTLRGVGAGRPGLNSFAIILVPRGTSFFLSSFCTPKASDMEPATCLYFFASISENASNKIKKHINRDIKSAKVPIQAGEPGGGHLHSSSSITRFHPATHHLLVFLFLGYRFAASAE